MPPLPPLSPSFAPVEEVSFYDKAYQQFTQVFAPLPVLVSVGLIIAYRMKVQ